jgi:dolichol-phosphate mannosyltransferase
MSYPSDALVIIPTYNERDNVQGIIAAVMNLEEAFDVLIVDDGSPDGTGALVLESQKLFPNRVHLLSRTGKLGLGTAYIAGFKWGLERNYEFFCEMDADFSHPVHKLIELKRACVNGADVAIGSRYLPGGKLENWPKDRIFLSKGASLYVRVITGMPVMDPTAGFICYTRKVLESLDLNAVKFKGYAFQIGMKYLAFRKKFKLTEIPITFKDREVGVSKMNSSIIKEAIWGVIEMRFSK